MNLRAKKHGISLTEMVIVVAGVALLAYLTVPSVSSLIRSFDSPASARTLISGALASARAIAAREHRYAGIRFQKAFDSDNPLEAAQYMIFIVHDVERTGLASGFRAVEGLEPIRLPDSVGVTDLRQGSLGDALIEFDVDFVTRPPDWPTTVMDATTFSILFSPSGKLVRHTVRAQSANINDAVFNEFVTVRDGDAMFLEDQWSPDQPNDELSRASFIIYDSRRFEQAYRQGRAYSGCLEELVPEMIYINSYTGTMISGD